MTEMISYTWRELQTPMSNVQLAVISLVYALIIGRAVYAAYDGRRRTNN